MRDGLVFLSGLNVGVAGGIAAFGVVPWLNLVVAVAALCWFYIQETRA